MFYTCKSHKFHYVKSLLLILAALSGLSDPIHLILILVRLYNSSKDSVKVRSTKMMSHDFFFERE